MNPEDIRREVSKRQARAKELGICEAVLTLHRDHLGAFTTWITKFPHYVHPCVSEAVQINRETIGATINDQRYVFRYAEHSFFAGDGDATMGKMTVTQGEKTILEFSVHIHAPDNEWGETKYQPGEITAFVEDKWVNELKTLPALLKAHRDEQARIEKKKKDEDPEKLEDLKKRFGI